MPESIFVWRQEIGYLFIVFSNSIHLVIVIYDLQKREHLTIHGIQSHLELLFNGKQPFLGTSLDRIIYPNTKM